MYCPFSRTVGSKVPRVAFVTGATPEAKVVKVVGLPFPSSREYSSFHEPVETEPMIGVGLVISWPSANPAMLTTGGGGGCTTAGSTFTVTCAVAASCVSLARSCNTYDTATVKITCVTAAFGVAKLTAAVPLIFFHVMLRTLPAGFFFFKQKTAY